MRLLNNAVAAMFLSFIVGMLVNAFLHRLGIHNRFRNSYLFSKLASYERLGVLWYRTLLLATPLRFFNQNIRFSADRSLDRLESIKMHMADAEVSHWIGLAVMLALNIVAWWYSSVAVGAAYLVLNILGNFYPCLLQQYNRLRLEKVISIAKNRHAQSIVSCQVD